MTACQQGEKVFYYRQLGMSFRAIGEKLGVSKARAAQILRARESRYAQMALKDAEEEAKDLALLRRNYLCRMANRLLLRTAQIPPTTTDRKLLELAAKAAGIAGEFSKTIGGWDCIALGKKEIPWQPLHDDEQAVQLAVALFGGGDPAAACRRAIVSAAAAIGQQMDQFEGMY